VACRSLASAVSFSVRPTSPGRTSALTVERFLVEVWLPRRRRELRPTTARRYQWYVDNGLLRLGF
jgi:hypothetical protein